MKVFSLLAVLLLAFCVTPARAQQGPDDQFVNIYGMIQQADALADGGQPRLALAAYLAAQAELQKFARIYPEWSPNIITFREHYLADKISATAALLPPGTAAAILTPAPAAGAAPVTNAVVGTADPLDDLRHQVQSLQNDNANLAAKLKEALTAQPAAADPQALAAAQEKVVALMKENDLLRASAAVGKPAVETAPAAKMSRSEARKLTDQLQEKVKTLEARLAVDEAPAVPYTTEELGLFQAATPVPALATAVVKVDHQLPAGSDDLVASARAHFAAHEYDQAAADYQKVLQMDKNNGFVLANLAAIELQQGHLADAEKHVQVAFAQNASDPFTLSVLGNLKFQQQKYDEALDILSKAAQLDPQNPSIESLLGVSLGHKGLRLQAETALRKALVLDPDYGAAHYNLAVVYLGEQPPRAELARWHYLKALAAGQPHNPDLEKQLADDGAAIPAP